MSVDLDQVSAAALARSIRELAAIQRMALPQWFSCEQLRARYAMSQDKLRAALVRFGIKRESDFGPGLHPTVHIDDVLRLDEALVAEDRQARQALAATRSSGTAAIPPFHRPRAPRGTTSPAPSTRPSAEA